MLLNYIMATPIALPGTGTGISQFVKDTIRPLFFDMEKHELVVTADRKGTMQGTIEARGESLDSLRNSIRKVADNERRLSSAKTALVSASSIKKTQISQSQQLAKQLQAKQSALAAAKKGVASYTTCAAAGKKNMMGRLCSDQLKKYTNEAATLNRQVKSLEAGLTEAGSMVSLATTGKNLAKNTLSTVKSNVASTVKPSKWKLWGGKTRKSRKNRRQTRRRRNY